MHIQNRFFFRLKPFQNNKKEVSLKLVMSLEVFPVKATKKEGKFDLYNEI